MVPLGNPVRRFASAVAAFGMLLRDSPFNGSATFDDVMDIAGKAGSVRLATYSGEFVDLVVRARALHASF